jgi:HAD superfamily hydrolase (TIGR01509 family)
MKHPTAQLAALIFDVDGTLAETERDGHRIAFNLAFEEAKLGWKWDEAYYGELLRVTGGKERIFEHWKRVDPTQAAGPLGVDTVRELHRRKTALFADIVTAGAIPLRPGVKRLLLEARERGLRVAIATTTSAENVDALVRSNFGIEATELFECIGAGDIVARKKPAPDIYEWTLRQMGLGAGQCVAFEDSVPGLQSASGAGLRTVVTRALYGRDSKFGDAMALLDGLGEPGSPATGNALGRTWTGVVDVDRILEWASAA